MVIAQCPGSASTPFDAARGGVTTTSGAFITSTPGSVYVQDGGLDNSDGGTLQISGDVYINGDLRLSNNTNIVVNNGGRLFVYGNVYINSGSTLTVSTGGNLYFYGEEWINQPGATINNSGGAGTISYIMPRPAPGANDPVSGSARYPDNATAYTSTANGTQYIDGGGVNMNVNIAQYNANNLSLCNLDNSSATGSGDTYLGGQLSFSVNEGDILLNNNNFVFTATGTYTHAGGINPYDGYLVTNGAGAVRKDGINDGIPYIFPVGQAENDYTPATIINNSGAASSYTVQVTNYANSGSVEGEPDEGVDRTWKIYSSGGGLANVCLSHNTAANPAGPATNGSLFNNASGFVTQQTGSGFWSTGSGTDGGSPVSIHCGDFTIPNNTHNASIYFSKSTDPVTPLPVTLTGFNGSILNCSAQLKWETSTEVNSAKYVVQHSTDGSDYSKIGEVPSENNINGASYGFNYGSLSPGTNYFRLEMVDKDGRTELSPVITLQSNCEQKIQIAPNPVTTTLTIRGLSNKNQVLVFSTDGKQLVQSGHPNGILQINTAGWAKGMYMVIITENGKAVRKEKIVKQ